MPKTLVWRGDAQAIAQVTDVAFANLEENDTITATINRKDVTIEVVAGADASDPPTAQDLLDAAVTRMAAAIGQYSNTIAEFAEISAAIGYEDDLSTNDIDRLVITGPTDGKPFTITFSAADAASYEVSVVESNAAQAGQNEIQQISLPSGVSGGTFTVSYNGVASAAIAWNAAAATVEAAIEGIAGVGAGQATTTGTGPWLVEFTGTFAQTDVNLLVGDGSSLTGTLAITATEITKGRTGQNSVWDMVVSSGTSWGVYVGPDDGVTEDLFSGWLASTDSATTVQAAIEALSTVGTGNVTVSTITGGYRMEFIGSLARVDMTARSVNSNMVITEVTEADTTVVAEVQDVKVPVATGGTFTLSFDGQTTAAIAYDASAATVEAALELLSTIGAGNIDLTESSTPAFTTYRCTFAGTLTGVDQSTITGSGASLTGAAVYVDVTQSAQLPVNESQTVSFDDAPSGGTFTLTYGGATSAALAFDISAANLETALEAMASIDAVEVTGSGPWVVEFQGTLAATDVALMVGDGALLEGADTQTATPTLITSPTGPNYWDQAENWHDIAAPTVASAPAAGDTVVFRDNAVSCLYGLETNSGDTLAACIVESSYTGSIGLLVRNESYFEYRPTSLACGFTLLTIGTGDGAGSSRLRFDLEAISSTVEVYRTGSSETDFPALILKGGGATTSLSVYRGDVGVAVEQAGDTATIQTIVMSYIDSQDRDSELWLGDGVGTVASIDKSGGALRIDDSVVTALVQTGGETVLRGNDAVADVKIYEGDLVHEGEGTLTALLVGGKATVDFSRVQKSRTVTACTVYAGATIDDPHSTVTWTNGITYDRCGFDDTDIDIGSHKVITITDGA